MRVRNLVVSWFSVATGIAVAFVVAPILVSSLGMAGYGQWCVINALAAQLALVELGLIASANRELNGQVAANRLREASSTLSTATVILGVVTLGVTLLIFAGSFLTPLSGDVRLALLIMLVTMALKLANTPFISNLQCHERLDLVGGVQIAMSLIRVTLIIALTRSLNILLLSYIHLLSTVFNIFLVQLFCRRVAPEIKFSIHLVRLHAVKRLKAIAIWTALKRFAQQVYTSTDTLIIGGLVSTTAVTNYSLGFVLPDHSSNFTRQINRVFSPKILKDAQLDKRIRVAGEVRTAMILCAAAGTPIFLGILVFGSDFFTLWMGEGFEMAFHIAVIFACLAFFRALHQPIHSVLLGVGEVRKPAIIFSVAAVLNVLMSVVLCQTPLGIYGVAVASFVTVAVSEAVCIRLAFTWINAKATQYLRVLCMTSVLAAVFLVIGVFVQQLPGELSWALFIAKCSASLLIYSAVAWPVVASFLKLPLLPILRGGIT